MKTIFATLATVAFGLIALPEKAEARPYHVGYSSTYSIGNSSCGCPLYQRRVVSGYDHYQRPTYRYYSVPVTHRCRSSHRSSYYGGSHSRQHYSRNHYSRSYQSGHRGHSSVSYRTRYGNVRICR